MKRAIGLEHLTLLECAPPEFVSLAAAAGFDTVGLRVSPVTRGEQAWPLSPGSPMLAETMRRCSDTGVSVHAVEAIALGPESDLTGHEPVIETAAALGARYLNVICDDPVPAALPRGQRADAGGDSVLEARAMRLLPGEGELPLTALLGALPEGMLVSVEAPSATALAALGPTDYIVRARRAVLALAG